MAHLATARRGSPRRTLRPRLTARDAPPHDPRDRRVPAAIAAGALVSWELLARSGVIPAVFFPAPSAIARALVESTISGELPRHLGATLLRLLPGLVLGGLPGLLAGLAMGRSRPLRAITDPFVAALHPIPKLALLPLFMILFGIGELSKIVVIAAAAFFPILINGMAGVRQIRPAHIDIAISYGAGRATLWRHVIVPASLPFVFAGVRIATNLALLVTIAVEMTAADTGLGALVWLSWQVLRIERLYATLVILALLGLALNSVLEWLARRFPGGMPEMEQAA